MHFSHRMMTASPRRSHVSDIDITPISGHYLLFTQSGPWVSVVFLLYNLCESWGPASESTWVSLIPDPPGQDLAIAAVHWGQGKVKITSPS